VSDPGPPGPGPRPGPGLVIVQLDGLAESTVRRAIDDGLMPTLERWLRDGSHRMLRWEAALPSQTSASQAGILYGDTFDIPGFRWFEKDRGRLNVSNHPQDAARLDRRLSEHDGLLEHGGSSLANLLSGEATHVALTLSRLGSEVGRRDALYRYLAYPPKAWRTVVLVFREVLVEIGQGWRQRLRRVRPRVRRGGSFPFLRAASNVVLRDLTLSLLLEDIANGVPVTYCTFVGYDVVAHHAGPERRDALKVLSQLDGTIATIEEAARGSAGGYALAILSDHGQGQGMTFRQRYRWTLEELVRRLALGVRVQGVDERGEGWGYLDALLTEALHGDRRAARVARRYLRPRTRDGYVAVGPDRDRTPEAGTEIVVCASGPLGHVYLLRDPSRLSLETMEAWYPGLVMGLVAHPGIAFALVRSEILGPIVIGARGVHRLRDGSVEGVDPLDGLGPHAADHLRGLDRFPHTGDIVVNGRIDRETGEVASFEELVGSHGGLGGEQTAAFLLHPAEWTVGEEPLIGAAAIHAVLRDAVGRLAGTSEGAVVAAE
jgi:hypothetical protein